MALPYDSDGSPVFEIPAISRRDGSATVTEAPGFIAIDPVSGLSTNAKPSTGTPTQVASSITAVTILAANTARKGANIVNDSTSILYLILSSTTPTSSIYTIAMDAKGNVGSYYEVPYGYTGIVKGIWASANGNAVVTELA